ncbi:hypothetical protein VB773_22635 [Haloarculaceae archaeon H-GB2-1]|nr:hypothetical protein [Haloarculaceae archaeon H-GB1-1]MEA5389453.1 hypothetical protein [Haloarculaceae archaeon H-GB11]MEA5410098.1 hypothetical protein [Haloarculaceae archaeon H-GB2-1]
MLQTRTKSATRLAIVAGVLLLAGLVVATGPAAAHNPAGMQTAGEDGPHYDGSEQTGSDTAFEQNPTLGGEFNDNAVDSCSVGHSESPNYDCGH